MLSSLEKGIRELVEAYHESGKPCPSKQTIPQRRAGYLASTELAGKSPVVHSECLDEVNGVSVKVYKPANKTQLPVTVYFHGGCFVSGGFETHDVQMRQVAMLANTVVICIKYRLAPEYVYPSAHEDVYQAALGIKEVASRYGGDTENITFIGDSAGGHLALATTLKLKSTESWLPRKQILIYPMLDPFGKSDSYSVYGTDYLITADMLLSGFALYAQGSENNSALSELDLLTSDFSDLPPTVIITAEFDPLRDEGERLHELLISHGVDAHCKRFLGVIHGFFQLSGISESGQACVEFVAEQINR
ncbi:alpha/beta hydrolase [Aestuariibacter sp. AA17]|uniref:Alpha/beta hydrolase n=1 Tax=Fluctibacter corallii TaxID=2984329 RepID=A0ABT3A5H3_9ALTE|nr:alpha/beta hydrolase [Aestuariibacter sp. AA17]MCV2883920.1 alpha/beta hydrolase [Aestuariibacter sp. AA17]